MRATIYYNAPGVTGHMEINTEKFFPCRKADLTTLKKKVVDLQWNENTRECFICDLIDGIKGMKVKTLMEERYFLEQAREGKLAKTSQEKKQAHFRRMLKDLDMNQEVVESWLQEPN